jgi:hypothetical protein
MYGTEKISSRLKNVTNSWTAEWVWEKCPYVKGIGDVYFKTHVGEKSSTGILKNVFYAVFAESNLILNRFVKFNQKLNQNWFNYKN